MICRLSSGRIPWIRRPRIGGHILIPLLCTWRLETRRCQPRDGCRPMPRLRLFQLAQCVQQDAVCGGLEDIRGAIAWFRIPELVPIKRDPNGPVDRRCSIVAEWCGCRDIEASQ